MPPADFIHDRFVLPTGPLGSCRSTRAGGPRVGEGRYHQPRRLKNQKRPVAVAAMEAVVTQKATGE